MRSPSWAHLTPSNTPWSLFYLTSNSRACRFVLVGLNKIIIITTMICMVLSSWLRAIARVYVVHLINAYWALGGCQPSDQANQHRLRVRRSIYHPHSPSPFAIITQPEGWYSFYHPKEGRKLWLPGRWRNEWFSLWTGIRQSVRPYTKFFTSYVSESVE